MKTSFVSLSEVIARYSFEENGLRYMYFKTSDYIPPQPIDRPPKFIFFPVTESIGLELPPPKPEDKARYIALMNPRDYPRFADMMAANNIVIQEYAVSYQIRPKGVG